MAICMANKNVYVGNKLNIDYSHNQLILLLLRTSHILGDFEAAPL